MIQTINPPMFLTNKHFQTILPTLLPANMIDRDYNFKKHSIHTSDNATLVVYSHLQKESPENKDDLLLVHGLEGSADSSYIIRLANYALERNFNVHRMNLRGCGESFPYNEMPYHAGLWQDVWEVCKNVKTGKRLFLTGFSLGGNLVLKLAGELNKNLPEYIAGVISVSGAIDMAATAQWLDQNPIYQRYLLWYLMRSYRRRCSAFPQKFQGLLSHRPYNLFDFDNQITARVYGFAGAEDYYNKAASYPVLPKIQIPSLLVYAQDDPMVPRWPYEQQFSLFQESPYLRFLETRHGGHVGFMGPKLGQFCINEIVLDFIENLKNN